MVWCHCMVYYKHFVLLFYLVSLPRTLNNTFDDVKWKKWCFKKDPSEFTNSENWEICDFCTTEVFDFMKIITILSNKHRVDHDWKTKNLEVGGIDAKRSFWMEFFKPSTPLHKINAIKLSPTEAGKTNVIPKRPLKMMHPFTKKRGFNLSIPLGVNPKLKFLVCW